MKKTIIFSAMLMGLIASAQDTTLNATESNANPFTFSGYVEAYYVYDFNQPVSNTRPRFLYSHNRHNEFNLNLGFIKGSYTTERVRANLAFASGTYMNANYAAEPGVLKNIYEANAGYKLSHSKNLWFDIGILPSHIGFESAVSKDAWVLTRSLMAENSPYFESGARLSYVTGNGKLTISALALNGWQRIKRVDGNSLLSWGTQIYFKPTEKITLNYSTFFGTDKPDTARLIRSFHNVYGVFQFTDKIGLTAGFDIGWEEKTVNDENKNLWYAPVAIVRITTHKKWAIAIRGEYYSDEKGVIIVTNTPNGFKTKGISLNVDYMPVRNAVFRIELRTLNSKDEIFTKNNGSSSNSNNAITFSTSISF